MIYGGLDESENLLESIYLLDLRNSFWHKVDSVGSKPTKRDSQTCTQINNVCYIFGGQVIIISLLREYMTVYTTISMP